MIGSSFRFSSSVYTNMKKAFLLHVLPNFISLLKSSKVSGPPSAPFLISQKRCHAKDHVCLSMREVLPSTWILQRRSSYLTIKSLQTLNPSEALPVTASQITKYCLERLISLKCQSMPVWVSPAIT